LSRQWARRIANRSLTEHLRRELAYEGWGSGLGLASLPVQNDPANRIWADLNGGKHWLDGDGNAARSVTSSRQVAVGYDAETVSGWLGGAMFRYTDQRLKIADRSSQTDIDSYDLAVYGGGQAALGSGLARFILGGGLSRHHLDSDRYVTLGQTQHLQAAYNGYSQQIFTEGSYAWKLGGSAYLEPFVGLTYDRLRLGEVNEFGGLAALHSAGETSHSLAGRLGTRLYLPLSDQASLNAEAAWLHSFGTLDTRRTLNFVQGGNSFRTHGVDLERDAAMLRLGAEYQLRDNLTLSGNLNGSLSQKGSSFGGGLLLSLGW
jgi:outer membrane autotransporter protein